MYCHKCGKKCSESENFCSKCGTQLVNEKNKTITISKSTPKCYCDDEYYPCGVCEQRVKKTVYQSDDDI